MQADPTAQRVKNMKGLFGPQSLQPKLDIYSDATGSLSDAQCADTSNGMSNSQGYLCLDQQTIAIYSTTRGGNQTACAFSKTHKCMKTVYHNMTIDFDLSGSISIKSRTNIVLAMFNNTYSSTN